MERPNRIKAARPAVERRHFLKTALMAALGFASPVLSRTKDTMKRMQAWIAGTDYDPSEHYYGMAVDVDKCIGCGSCAAACKTENGVPEEPFFFKTWVERYRIFEDGSSEVDSPEGAVNGFRRITEDGRSPIRNFFVPKLCNHCDNPPCVQVCPVGATYKTPDGVVLMDREYCIGCRYCIQACPYGARYLDPVNKTADKCTFCYHRVVKGLEPACVENCPTEARIFGEVKKKASPLMRFRRMNKISVLKPALNTEPKVYYANLDMEVR